MKKMLLVYIVIVLALLCGCVSGEQSADHSQICQHPEEALGGLPQYVSGKYCDDPVEIYLTCNICGELVLRGTMPGEFECRELGDTSGTVIREPSCTEAGLWQGNCFRCGKLLEREIATTEHKYYWFYQEDAPRCAVCSMPQKACEHEYEMNQLYGYTEDAPGKRYYQCKNCDYGYPVYFDEYGDYDFCTAFNAVCDEALKYGWTVIYDYNLLYGNELSKNFKAFNHSDVDSTEVTKVLTDAGMELLNLLNENYYSPDNDRSDYYLTVVPKSNGTYINIYLYVRWEE